MLSTAKKAHLYVKLQGWLAQLPDMSEIFWFSVCLLLFMILGPFAAPFALFAIMNLDSEYRGNATPELMQ